MLIAFGVMAVVMVGLFAVADRIAVGVAEGRLTDEMRSQLASNGITVNGDPRASISGFPFLTQVMGGEYDKITMNVDKPTTQDKVTLQRLEIVAERVKAPLGDIVGGSVKATAGRLTGTVTMGWDAIARLLQVSGLPSVDTSKAQISVVDNKVKVKFPAVAVMGTQVTVWGTGDLVVDKGVLSLKMTEVGTEGVDQSKLPAQAKRVLDQYRSGMTATVKVPALPYRLVVRSVTSSPAGAVIVASADQVSISG